MSNPVMTGGDVDTTAQGMIVNFDQAVLNPGGASPGWTLITDHGNFDPGETVVTSGNSLAFDWFTPTKWVLAGETVTVQYDRPPGIIQNAGGEFLQSATQGITNNSTLVRGAIVEATVDSTGTSVAIWFVNDSNLFLQVTTTHPGNGTGWVLNSAEQGAVGLTYVSGEGTDTLTFLAASTIFSGDVLTLDYTPGDAYQHIENPPGSLDIDLPFLAFDDTAVTNNSTVVGEVNRVTFTGTVVRRSVFTGSVVRRREFVEP